MQLTVFTSPLFFFFNHGLMCFSQVPLLSLTVNTHTNAYIFITMKSSKPNQLIAPMNFTLLFIVSPFINQIYVLEKFSVSKTGQISDLRKLYCAKKAFWQPKTFQQIHVQSQNCYEMGFCVQVVPSGRASIKSNQVKKKKKKRRRYQT